jgi:hypothetical protein
MNRRSNRHSGKHSRRGWPFRRSRPRDLPRIHLRPRRGRRVSRYLSRTAKTRSKAARLREGTSNRHRSVSMNRQGCNRPLMRALHLQRRPPRPHLQLRPRQLPLHRRSCPPPFHLDGRRPPPQHPCPHFLRAHPIGTNHRSRRQVPVASGNRTRRTKKEGAGRSAAASSCSWRRYRPGPANGCAESHRTRAFSERSRCR